MCLPGLKPKGQQRIHLFWRLQRKSVSSLFQLLESACLPGFTAPFILKDSNKCVTLCQISLILLPSSSSFIKTLEIPLGPLDNPRHSPCSYGNLYSLSAMQGDIVIGSGDSDTAVRGRGMIFPTSPSFCYNSVLWLI